MGFSVYHAQLTRAPMCFFSTTLSLTLESRSSRSTRNLQPGEVVRMVASVRLVAESHLSHRSSQSVYERT